ncbi:MAG: cob(I)yrinic acid a,c-diamide adenosyltransferase [Bacillota bacterium]
MEKGLIHIYTGNGKGKTTASVGLAVRCAGSGRKVVFTQLMKGNHSSERNVLEHLDGVFVIPAEKNFGFSWNLTEEEKAEAKEVYTRQFERAVAKAEEEQCRMIVFDEIISAYNYDMIDRERVLAFLRNKREDLEVVLTGREPAAELTELAAYVSEIGKVKHPYDNGTPFRKGIEF